MITARLSDVWGLKTVLLACGAIFFIFSMACGAAQTMTQLYVSVLLRIHNSANCPESFSVPFRVSAALASTRSPSCRS